MCKRCFITWCNKTFSSRFNFVHYNKENTMTYILKKDATKEDLDKILKEIFKKKKGMNMSRFAGKLKLPDGFDVIEWQRRQRDDGTYNY